MGKDNNNSEAKKDFEQTLKSKNSDGKDIEFSEELADANDKEAEARAKAAERKMKEIL